MPGWILLEAVDLIALTVSLSYVAGIVSSVHAVMATRTSQGAIAWLVSLVTFPMLSVPLYWVFGRDKFHGYRLSKTRDLAQIRSLWEREQGGTTRLADLRADSDDQMLGSVNLARIPALRGNRVELLIDGSATFDSIFAGIDAAEDYVLVQFYIVRADAVGRELKRRLIAAVESRVRVYFVYDEIGSIGLPQRYLNDLHVAGVEVLPFNSRKGMWNRFQLNFRNHRKVVVVDGRVAWLGGHNVGDEYLGRDPAIGAWRDTHIRIEGPSVLGVQLSFVEDWGWASDTVLDDLHWSARQAKHGNSTVLVVASGPADSVETAALMFRHALNTARDRIWIASPYFVPDQGIITALQLAALRGIDVRILIPEKSDNPMVTLAAYAYFDEIAETGVSFWRYDGGFLHEKAMLIDDAVAAVGTANFDNRSFRLNFEITAFVHDEVFAAEVETMFRRDFEQARCMQPGEYERKSFGFRLATQLSRLAAPVL